MTRSVPHAPSPWSGWGGGAVPWSLQGGNGGRGQREAVGDALAPGRHEPRHVPAPPPLHRPPRGALPYAAADPRVCGALVHRDGRGAGERPVARRARRVRGNPPAVPILVPGPLTADRWPVMPALTASMQIPSGHPEPHPASPQPASLRLRSAGGRVGRRPIPEGRVAPLSVEGARVNWSVPPAPGSCGSCRPGAAVKVERPTGRTTLTAARTGRQ